MDPLLNNDEIKYVFPDTVELDHRNIRDIAADALDEDGRLRVLPAAFWASTTVQERALFGHRQGLYSFPTTELVEHLQELIDGRLAIEIGAGNGVLAEALGIPATDNFQQLMPKYRLIYASTRQPIVPYGRNVVDMHASKAVRHYKPQVVIGAWISHRYDPARHEAGGNEIGVDMADVLLHCEELVLIGNEKTHAGNPLWSRPKRMVDHPEWLYSRASNGSPEFIGIWRGAKKTV